MNRPSKPTRCRENRRLASVTRRRALACRSALIPLLLAIAFGSPVLAEPRIERSFEEHQEHIVNPDCGWVAYNYEDSYALRRRVARGEPFDLASVVYTRHPSRAWLDEDGEYGGSAPLTLLEDWMANGRHVAFRVYANRMADLPDSVAERVESFEYERRGGTRQAIKYWDAEYIEDHRRLVAFLGERLADSPYLAYVDIGGVGDTGGEWFFSSHDAYRRAGLDDDAFYELVREFTEMYREAFPNTRLFISYEAVAKAGARSGDAREILEEHGIGVRDDGLSRWPYPRQNPSLSAWPMPTFWPSVPVLFEGAGAGGGVYGWQERQGLDAEAILEWAFKIARPSYINIGGAESVSERACSELRDLLLEYGRRLGYRFALLRASSPATMRRGQPTLLRMTWANRGVAPCYADRPLEVSLVEQATGRAVRVLADPEPSTRSWAPERETEVRAAFTPPADLSPGAYTLKIRLVWDADSDEPRGVNIGTKGADAEGRYDVGEVAVER